MKDEKVGYRQPPKSCQWKKGQSGNPAGRPRKPPPSTDDAEILRRLDAELVEAAGREVPRRKAELLMIFGLSVRGNRKARRLIERLLKSVPRRSGGGTVEVPWEEFDRITG